MHSVRWISPSRSPIAKSPSYTPGQFQACDNSKKSSPTDHQRHPIAQSVRDLAFRPEDYRSPRTVRALRANINLLVSATYPSRPLLTLVKHHRPSIQRHFLASQGSYQHAAIQTERNYARFRTHSTSSYPFPAIYPRPFIPQESTLHWTTSVRSRDSCKGTHILSSPHLPSRKLGHSSLRDIWDSWYPHHTFVNPSTARPNRTDAN
jgi:hypothetical protein